MLGQMVAILRHFVSNARLEHLKNSGVPIMVMTGSPHLFLSLFTSLSLILSLGTNDKLVRYENSLILKDALQPRQFALYEGAGHMIHEECANSVNASLLEHFDFGFTKSSTNRSSPIRMRSKL